MVRVGHVHPEPRSLPADVAHGCHGLGMVAVTLTLAHQPGGAGLPGRRRTLSTRRKATPANSTAPPATRTRGTERLDDCAGRAAAVPVGVGDGVGKAEGEEALAWLRRWLLASRR